MFREFREAMCCFLILMLVGSGGPAIAKDMTGQQMKDVVRRMADNNCRVRMKDGTSLQGQITHSDSESFTVAGKSGSRTVAYADVAEVKKKGMHPAAKVAIGVIAVGVLLCITLVAYADGSIR